MLYTGEKHPGGGGFLEMKMIGNEAVALYNHATRFDLTACPRIIANEVMTPPKCRDLISQSYFSKIAYIFNPNKLLPSE